MSFTASPTGQAVVLGDGHLNVDHYALEFVSNLDAFTVAVRYQWLSDASTPQSIFALGDNGMTVQENDMRLQFGAENTTVVTQTGEGEIHTSVLTESPALNTWHNLVVVFEDGTAHVFQDGDDLGSALYTPAETLADELLIGNNACCGHQFNGLLDDFALYGAALTSEQALALSEL